MLDSSVNRGAQEHRWMQKATEILVSLNVAVAVGYGLLASGFTSVDTKYAPEPVTAFRYFFLRSALRADALLHLREGSKIGQELTFGLSVVSLAVLLLLILRSTPARVRRFLLIPVAGLTSLLAVPVSLLWVAGMAVSSMRPTGPDKGALPPWNGFGTFILLADLMCICILFFLVSRRILSMWVRMVLLLLHCGWWGFVLWQTSVQTHLLSAGFLPLVVFPASGLMWLVNADRSRPSEEWASYSPAGMSLVFGSLASVAILLFLWLPPRSQKISSLQDLRSLTITLSRNGCFGGCPAYKVTVRGTGLAEYSGMHNVAMANAETTMSMDQLRGLLRELDGVDFFALQDHLFERCPDAPTVSLTVSVSDKEKSVTSDVLCVGARSSPQAKFVRLAQHIDSVVGTDRWVKCEGPCLR
jgi:hypothetical protein